MGISDGQYNLCKQSFNSDTDDLARKLIPATDAPESFAGLSCILASIGSNERLQHRFGDPVVATNRLDGLHLSSEDPVLDRWIRNPNHSSGFPRCQQVHPVWHVAIIHHVWRFENPIPSGSSGKLDESSV
jgi:hypothetical protein